ncbi:MAG: Bax inhibitor-1 family protein [Pseudomonadota bacterium]
MLNDPSEPSSQTDAAGVFDADFRMQTYLCDVYLAMGMGLAVSWLAAYGIGSIPALSKLFTCPTLTWAAMLTAPVLTFWFICLPSQRFFRMSLEGLRVSFILYSAVVGLALETIFRVFAGISVACVFFIAAAAFAATSLYGRITGRDLTSSVSLLFMGLIGIFIAGLMSLLFPMAMEPFAGSFLRVCLGSAMGVWIFISLIAWEKYRLRSLYSDSAPEDSTKVAIIGAFRLYLAFGRNMVTRNRKSRLEE